MQYWAAQDKEGVCGAVKAQLMIALRRYRVKNNPVKQLDGVMQNDAVGAHLRV
jgi:hypothetical protein